MPAGAAASRRDPFRPQSTNRAICHPERSEGSAFEARPGVLCLYPRQPFTESVHWSDQQLERAGVSAQAQADPGFTSKYRIHRLVHVERFGYIHEAIRREKQIKGWRREKKVALIELNNPTWEDLAAEWCEPPA
jgi:putative endonuclease